MIGRVFRQWFTSGDNCSFELGRALWAASVLAMIAYQGVALWWKAQPSIRSNSEPAPPRSWRRADSESRRKTKPMEAHRELPRQADFDRECRSGGQAMSGLAFGIAAKSAGGFLFRAGAGALGLVSGIDWAKMWWIVPLGAAIVFALVERGEAVHQRKLDQRDAAGWAAEKKAHSVTKASLDGALTQIADNNKRVDAAAAELERERQRAAADLAQADARWRATKASVEALNADARDPSRKPCTVSAEAKKAMEGL